MWLWGVKGSEVRGQGVRSQSRDPWCQEEEPQSRSSAPGGSLPDRKGRISVQVLGPPDHRGELLLCWEEVCVCLCFLWHVPLSWRLEMLGVPVDVRMLLEMLKIRAVLGPASGPDVWCRTSVFS